MIYRRFSRALKEDPGYESTSWPDLILIDGGKGHISAVYEVLNELGIDDIVAIGVSKGPDRNAGREQFHTRDKKSFTLKPDSPVMHYLQRLRDEAHRFAINSHRAQRARARTDAPGSSSFFFEKLIGMIDPHSEGATNLLLTRY